MWDGEVNWDCSRGVSFFTRGFCEIARRMTDCPSQRWATFVDGSSLPPVSTSLVCAASRCCLCFPQVSSTDISIVYLSNTGSLSVYYYIKGPPAASKEHIYGLKMKLLSKEKELVCLNVPFFETPKSTLHNLALFPTCTTLLAKEFQEDRLGQRDKHE